MYKTYVNFKNTIKFEGCVTVCIFTMTINE
jgi:hypothetical protein